MKSGTKVLYGWGMATLLLIAVQALGFLTPGASREFRLQANSPEFWNLVDRNAKLAVVGMGFGFTEGPMWDEAGFL
ncbi:MAG: hypothetical protein WCA16_13165, partial [Candidatus Sulfotelmatobacter sp.]